MNANDQLRLYYQAERKAAEANLLFLDMVQEGMTRQTLQKLIERRPALWGRWSNWLETLPEESRSE